MKDESIFMIVEIVVAKVPGHGLPMDRWPYFFHLFHYLPDLPRCMMHKWGR
jgi:hypothetical protein